MWAFSLWDERIICFSAVVIAMASNPFYYAVQDGVLYWGSEIKQLLLTQIDKTLNRAMILA